MNAKENSRVVSLGEVDTTDFNALYEKGIDRLIKMFVRKGADRDPHLVKKLKNKRKIGIEKYGEASFQSNYQNAMNSPTIDHAMDELLDCMNYLLHERMLKAPLLYPEHDGMLLNAFNQVLGAYGCLSWAKEQIGKKK